MLKIYSDKQFASGEAEYATMLAPFWGEPRESPDDPVRGRYSRYARVGAEFMQLVPPHEADIAVLPVHWEHVVGRPEAEAPARRFLDIASSAGLPRLVFFVSDATDPVQADASHVFRTSLYRSRPHAGEYAMPALCEDVLVRHRSGAPVLRRKAGTPSVSFCGLAPRPPRPWRRGRPAGEIRRVACDRLERSRHVETDFVLRDEFWGGAVRSGVADLELMAQVRDEYVANMLGSDYVLCARGGGNYSYRLYEALSAGRIPLFIDTDCVLPFEDRIDWRELCVWVDEREVDDVAERLASFHDSLTPPEFEERQHECRRIWERYLSPEGFYRTLAEQFSADVPAPA